MGAETRKSNFVDDSATVASTKQLQWQDNAGKRCLPVGGKICDA